MHGAQNHYGPVHSAPSPPKHTHTYTHTHEPTYFVVMTTLSRMPFSALPG